MHTHLLTGPGGAGVSSTAAALAEAAARGVAGGGEPPSVALGCLGDDGSLTTLLGHRSEVTVVDLGAPRPWGDLDTVVAATLERYGGDGDVAEEWRRLPGAEVLAALIAMGEAVASTDVLVVDLGDIRRAAELFAAAARAPYLLRGLLGLQALGARLVGPPAAHAVARWLDAVEAAAEVLRAPETLLHVVVGAGPHGPAKVRRNVPALLLGGVRPGAILLDPGSAGEAGPREGTAPAAPHPTDAPGAAWAPFTPLPALPLAPGGDGALDPSAVEAAATLLRLPAGPEPREPVTRAADHLTWRVRLPWLRAEDVRVEHRGEDLVVCVHGVPHLVVPPAVVRRCTPVRARLDGRHLIVESVLREGAWRRHG